ncbi:MAG: biotin/lipoyl-binding protein [Pseudomonadota bacterium]
MSVAARTGGGGSDDERLPPLRQSLQIVPCAAGGSPGSAAHMVMDPVRHQYVRLTRTMLNIFSAWDAATIPDLMRVLAQRNIRVTVEDVRKAIKFAHDNQLTMEPEQGGWRAFAGIAEKGRKSPFMQAAHTYVFFRVPLFRPQKALELVWPLIGWMFTRAFAVATAIFALISLYLVHRQWDVFMTSFSAFLTWDGFLAYAAALIVVKIIHEFGHAFMAHKYGVPVPVVGAAFIVLFPILYTDTTSAWTLSQRQRLMVDSAGIFTELTLAAYATLAWVFLPDGTMRDVAFVVATVSWIMSLVVNLNPLMRFDGYYILADATGVENLQSRGFALARWRVREWLFGFGDPVPEQFSPWAHRAIIFHAFCVWIYRFFLFLGIALLVYYKTTKVLGIILFVVEIMIFIGKPIATEMTQWGKRKADMLWNRQSIRSMLIAALILAVLFVPLSLPMQLPAVASSGSVVAIHPQTSGQIAQVNVVEGQRVEAGDVLYSLEAPSLSHERTRLLGNEALLKHRVARATADQRDRSNLTVLQSELDGVRSELRSLDARETQLQITAEASGYVRNVPPDMALGQWVSPANGLGVVVLDGPAQVTGYVAAERLRRVANRTEATFVADEPEFPNLPVSIGGFEVPSNTDPRLETLLDFYGGRIVSEQSPDRQMPAPKAAHYRVATTVEASSADTFPRYQNQEVRGVIRVWPEPESLAIAIGRRVAGVLIRESGF